MKKDTPAWLDRAVNQFDKDDKKDGEILSHYWIKWALDIKDPASLDELQENQWLLLTRFDAFRDYMLTERKIALQNVRGKGYRIVPPTDQAEFAAVETLKTIKNAFDKGDKLMTHCRLGELDTDAQRRHTDAHIKLCGIKDMVKRNKTDIFKLFLPESI